MVVGFTKETIGTALNLVKAVVPARPTNPLYAYIYLEGTGDDLVVRAASAEVDAEVRIPAPGLEFSPLLVPPAFIRAVEAASGPKVHLAAEEGRIVVSSGTWEAAVNTAESEGFPTWPDKEGGTKATIGVKELLRALGAVRYAASKDAWRSVFRGIVLEFVEGGLRAVASDGYRMAIYDTGIAVPLAGQILLPVSGADEAVRLLKEARGEATLTLHGSFITLTANTGEFEASLVVRLLEGEYPDYRRVIPTEFPTTVVLHAEELAAAVRRVSALSSPKDHRVDIIFDGESRLATLFTEGDYGRSADAVRAGVDGLTLRQAYDYRYLLDAIEPVEGEVVLHISGPATPTLIEPADGGGYKAVVVPLRV
ncbi:MAG: DNA polymerase III subunit beta [Thermus aquaticus]|uniref:DNA polymerase III subunit beta n=1 Tax=Thermus aquaticus TaxID=271 RepID=UPI003C127E00